MRTKWIYGLLMVAAIGIASCNDDEKPQTLPTVTTNATITTTTTTAMVSGEITDDGNASITEAGFVYSSLVSEPTTDDNKKTITDFDAFTAELTGLNSGTTYYVRAYAINKKGTAYGENRTFETGNLAPVVTSVQVSGTLEVAKTLTATYTYTDPEGDDEDVTATGTAFQWYVADNSTGTNETAIDGATAKTFVVTDEENGKVLRVKVTPKATEGTLTGTEILSPYTTAIGAETVTFTYNGVMVTYGTITTSTGKKWLDRNLGASRVAQSLTDYESYGDYFQWGRLADGHQVINRTGGTSAEASGASGTTETTSEDDIPETDEFIINTDPLRRDWRNPTNDNLWQGANGINNPCPTGWRIPTQEEWAAEFPDFTATEAFNRLKLSYTGIRWNDGSIALMGEQGYFWTSTIRVNTNGTSNGSYYTSFYVDGDASWRMSRANALTCRCVKD